MFKSLEIQNINYKNIININLNCLILFLFRLFLFHYLLVFNNFYILCLLLIYNHKNLK